MTRDGLRDALSHGNVRAFLAVIDLGEHGPNADSPDRYRTMFGGAKFDAPPWKHPRRAIKAGDYTSTAAGRGQFLAGTWGDLVHAWGFEDFSPPNQDEAMVALIARRKALEDVLEGRFEEALEKCAREWASLPGSPYGQPTITYQAALDRYSERGGRHDYEMDTLATEHYGEGVTESTVRPVPPADQQEAHMAPIILPLLQIAAQFLPQLAEKFGSGSEVSNRNLAAGKVLAEAIVTATNSPNLQAAVEKMQSDPEAVKAAKVAVAQEWPELFEIGGGIKAAREAAESQSGDWRKLVFSLPFVGIILFTPAIWAVVAASVFKAPWLLEMDPQLRGTVIGFVMGTLAGSICGYIFGSSMTKTPAQPSKG